MHEQAMNHISLKTAKSPDALWPTISCVTCKCVNGSQFGECVHMCVRYLTFFPIVALCVLHCPQKINDKLCVHVFRRRKYQRRPCTWTNISTYNSTAHTSPDLSCNRLEGKEKRRGRRGRRREREGDRRTCNINYTDQEITCYLVPYCSGASNLISLSCQTYNAISAS